VSGIAARVSRIRRARHEVERPEPDPVEHRGDLQDVVGAQPGGPPQALVAVPQRDVDELDLSHFYP
jgi:hypothetical protein